MPLLLPLQNVNVISHRSVYRNLSHQGSWGAVSEFLLRFHLTQSIDESTEFLDSYFKKFIIIVLS